MVDILIIIGIVIAVVLGATLLAFGSGARVVRQFERGVVFRLGRVLDPPREPGLTWIIPVVDHLKKVNVQIITLPVPAQEGITRDNVTVRVDAVVYFRVHDPVRSVVEVQDYQFAVAQVAQTSLRSIIGKSELDDLLSNREKLNQGLQLMLDSPAVGWGIEIDRVEIKDVALPETMKRSMSRQAEAERERRSRVITADGEFQASRQLAAAANQMAATPQALQLRLLQTIVEVAAEKNSTLVLPFPVELLRFLDQATGKLDASGSAPAVAAAPVAPVAPVAPAAPAAPASPETPVPAGPAASATPGPAVAPAERPSVTPVDGKRTSA
jgi:regulator of protease activity HflC (stomatin/prohibitin superfamily)